MEFVTELDQEFYKKIQPIFDSIKYPVPEFTYNAMCERMAEEMIKETGGIAE